MDVGTIVSPDFYGWVFPSTDHVGRGGTARCEEPVLIKGCRKGGFTREGQRTVCSGGESSFKWEAQPDSTRPVRGGVVGGWRWWAICRRYSQEAFLGKALFAAKSGGCARGRFVAAAPRQTQSLEKRSHGLISRSGIAITAPPYRCWKFSRLFIARRRQRSLRRDVPDDKVFQRLTF